MYKSYLTRSRATKMSLHTCEVYLKCNRQPVHDEALKFLRDSLLQGEYRYVYGERRWQYVFDPRRINLVTHANWLLALERLSRETKSRPCPVGAILVGQDFNRGAYAIIAVDEFGTFYEITEDDVVFSASSASGLVGTAKTESEAICLIDDCHAADSHSRVNRTAAGTVTAFVIWCMVRMSDVIYAFVAGVVAAFFALLFWRVMKQRA